jgi:hypothetical protein
MLSPEQMPDPWLFDSHFLLAELSRVRELISRIPLHLDTYGPTDTAIYAVNELESRLRFLLARQSEVQAAFRRAAADARVKSARIPRGNVVRLTREQAMMKKRAAAIGGLSA